MNISIVQLCLPHYRLPFFKHLSESIDDQLTIISGPYSMGGTPKTVSNPDGVKHQLITNLFLINRLAIQKPIPRSVYEDDIVVLEFNPRILTNIWIFWRRLNAGKSVILWGHGLSSRENSSAMYTRLRQYMVQKASAIIFYSEKGREDFRNLGIRDEKMFVASNTIDVQRILPLVSDNCERTNILFVGRLIPSKKADLLIKGFIKAIPSLPLDTKLVIIGDGTERAKLEAMVTTAGLENRIMFVGKLTNEKDLSFYFNRSMLSVSPGYLGLSANHSLAYRVPVLVARGEPHSPEIEVIREGETGEYFEFNSAEDLSRQIISLVSSPSNLSKMGKAGQELMISMYSLNNMVNSFKKSFQYSLKNSK